MKVDDVFLNRVLHDVKRIRFRVHEIKLEIQEMLDSFSKQDVLLEMAERDLLESIRRGENDVDV